MADHGVSLPPPALPHFPGDEEYECECGCDHCSDLIGDRDDKINRLMVTLKLYQTAIHGSQVLEDYVAAQLADDENFARELEMRSDGFMTPEEYDDPRSSYWPTSPPPYLPSPPGCWNVEDGFESAYTQTVRVVPVRRRA